MHDQEQEVKVLKVKALRKGMLHACLCLRMEES
jgi:hypothetical protein